MLGEGGEDASGATSTQSHPGPNAYRKGRWLTHALLDAATRGQALTSYQDHRNHRGFGCPGAGGSELRLELAAQEGLKTEQEVGKSSAFGLGTGLKFWLHHLGDFGQGTESLQTSSFSFVNW